MTDELASNPTSGSSQPMLRSQIESACSEFIALANTEISHADRQRFCVAIEGILEAAKLEALAEFAAGAGHEINNPVATIVGRAQLLSSDESDPNRAQALQIIGGQALRIRDMIGDVMLFARPPHPRPEFLRLADLAKQACDSEIGLKRQHGATIDSKISSDFQVWADRTQLLVLLSNLIRNSLEAADGRGIEIRLSASKKFRDDQEWAVIEIEDNGPGISAAVREHLFDPFFSGRQAGRGLGFGLAKCWRIAQMHGGWIDVPSQTNGTTQFVIWLPLSESSA